MTHIPPGIDVFASLLAIAPKTTYVQPVMDRIIGLIAANPPGLTTFVAGHFHFAGFRLVRGARSSVPIVDLPGISPVFGDAPAFYDAAISPGSGTIVDFTAYALRGLSFLRPQAPAKTTWIAEYTFSSSYGLHGITGQSIATLEKKIATDGRLRSLYFDYFASGSSIRIVTGLSWRAFRCGAIALAVSAYTTCLQSL